MVRTLLSLALSSALVGTPLTSQSAKESTKQKRSLLDKVRVLLAKKPSFRAKIRANGRPVDQLEVMRQLVYIAGTQVLEQKFTELATQAEMARQIKAGADPKSFAIKDSEIDAKQKTAVEKAGGLEEFKKKLQKQNSSLLLYRSKVEAELIFDRVFFPGTPDKWPQVTLRAIKALKDGEKFLERLPAKALTGAFGRILRQWVVAALRKMAKIEYAGPGLEPEYCLRVNGQAWKTRDALRVVGGRARPRERELAVCSVVLDAVVRRELARRKAWLDDEAIDRAFAVYSEPYDKTPFTVAVLAKSFKGYPNLPVYRKRWRLMHCFEQMIAKEITDKNLEAHIEDARLFLGDGRVRVDLLRIGYGDVNRCAAIEAARRCAEETHKSLVKGSLDFESAAELSPAIEFVKGERLVSLNEFRSQIGESEFLDFFSASSVAEEIFNKAKKGRIHGPLAGPDAFYIARVKNRAAVAAGAVTLVNAPMRKLVRQDYLDKRFLAWVRELAARIVLD